MSTSFRYNTISVIWQMPKEAERFAANTSVGTQVEAGGRTIAGTSRHVHRFNKVPGGGTAAETKRAVINSRLASLNSFARGSSRTKREEEQHNLQHIQHANMRINERNRIKTTAKLVMMRMGRERGIFFCTWLSKTSWTKSSRINSMPRTRRRCPGASCSD